MTLKHRKHFRQLAGIVCEARKKAAMGLLSTEDVFHYLERDLADMCERENSRFKRELFLRACKGQK